MKIVTLTTDFGDLSHDVSAGNISQGAFMLRYASKELPPGKVHVAVADPGVGGPRRAFFIKADKRFFIGPYNGLLIPAAKAIPGLKRISDPVRLDFGAPLIFNEYRAAIVRGLLRAGRTAGCEGVEDGVSLLEGSHGTLEIAAYKKARPG